MERDGVCTTFTYRLQPTPAHARASTVAVWCCRERYHAALQERRDAWRYCGVSVSFAGQSAPLPRRQGGAADDRAIN
jgi:hypothetical protein